MAIKGSRTLRRVRRAFFRNDRDRSAARAGEIVTPLELATLDRASLERRSRALVQPVVIGDGIVLCRILGRFKFFVLANDAGFGAHVMLDGVWESWLTVFMARLVKPGMNVVDVGANHGYYTLMFACLVGEAGRVAAVEPHPEVAVLLKRSVELNGFSDRTVVFQQAAGDVDGRKVFLGSPPNEPKNAHLLPRDAEAGAGRHRVRIAKVDTLLKSWDRVDFLKIDVEGAEEAAVGGMMEIIRRDRPSILLEFNAGRCASPEALLDLLESVYGGCLSIDLNGDFSVVDRTSLLNLSRRQDWMLYFQDARKGALKPTH